MITLHQIDGLLTTAVENRKLHKEAARSEGKDEAKIKRADARARKDCDFYRLIKSYLEHSPTAEYITKEIQRINKRIDLINEGFRHWLETNPGSINPKASYEREMGVPDLKQQLRALQFINNS
jgi:hypothetical protein